MHRALELLASALRHAVAGAVLGALPAVGLAVWVASQPMPPGEEHPQYDFALYGSAVATTGIGAACGAAAGLATGVIRRLRPGARGVVLAGFAVYAVLVLLLLWAVGVLP